MTPLLTRIVTPDIWEQGYTPEDMSTLSHASKETGVFLAELENRQHLRPTQVGKRTIRLARRMHSVRVLRSGVTRAIFDCVNAGDVVRTAGSFTTHAKIINRSVADELFKKRTLVLPDMREACVLQNELNAMDQQSPDAYVLREEITELDRRTEIVRDDIRATLHLGAAWGFITELPKI